jgi:hypothetical protein
MSYSIQRVTSDGTLTDVVVGIQYMAQSDITVYVDAILADGTRDYSYVWVNSNTIRISPVVPVGLEVLLARATYIDEMLHDYEAGAVFNPKSMDENFTQLLYNVQEGRERTDITDVYNDINMHNHKVYNLALATNDYDAIPYKQYKDDALGAQQAKEDAEEAARRAEAAAAASGAANQLVSCVQAIEEPYKKVYWKGVHLFDDAIYLYDVGGTEQGSFVKGGNIAGAVWNVPASQEWGGTNDAYSYLKAYGLDNGFRRLPGITVNGVLSRGLVVENNETGLGAQITLSGVDSARGMTILNYASPISGRAGINFVNTGNGGMTADNPSFNARIDNAGQIQAQTNILAGGDIVAFTNTSSERGILTTLEATLEENLFPNATTLEANPLEFGLVDIVEKLAEVIVNLKVKVEALEGALDAIRNPVV